MAASRLTAGGRAARASERPVETQIARETAWMSTPTRPPTTVPLIRMNCRSRPTCSSIFARCFLAVPPLDGLGDDRGELTAVAAHRPDHEVRGPRVQLAAERAVVDRSGSPKDASSRVARSRSGPSTSSSASSRALRKALHSDMPVATICGCSSTRSLSFSARSWVAGSLSRSWASWAAGCPGPGGRGARGRAGCRPASGPPRGAAGW